MKFRESNKKFFQIFFIFYRLEIVISIPNYLNLTLTQ